MANGVTAETLRELLSLTMEERRNLAAHLMNEDYQTGGGDFAQAMRQEARAQVEELKESPAAVWAAQVVADMDKLVLKLATLRDEAQEAASRLSSALEEASGITDQMLQRMTDRGSNSDILRLVAAESRGKKA